MAVIVGGRTLSPIENAYTFNGLKRSDRYDTSQLIRTGPNSFRDENGNVFDGLGRVPLPGQSTGMQRGAGGGGAGGPGDIPGASVMGQQVAAGLAEYKKALARLNQNRLGTLTQYGYAGDIDAESGALKNMRVDSSNPFGVYQGMRRNNAFQYSDLRDARMERGLGAKGLGAQGMDQARYQWGSADTAMAQALTGTLSGFDQQQQGAWQEYQNLLWQMQLEAARGAIGDSDFGYPGGDEEQGPEDPTLPPAVKKKKTKAALAKRVTTKKNLAKYGWGAAGAYAKGQPLPGAKKNISPSTKLTPQKAKAINAAIKQGGRR